MPRDSYLQRLTSSCPGRTVMGKDAQRPEMCDHYMAPLSSANAAHGAMKEIQEAFKLGIPLRTRHREVAPNQFEFAPMFGAVQTRSSTTLSSCRSSTRWLQSTTLPPSSRRSPSTV